MREIVLDTETTGLDPYSGHRIVEVGCVELYQHVPTGNYFHTYLNPEREMPKEAEAIHGLSGAFLADKPVFRAIAKSLLEFIGDSRLVIHNASFDMKFLNWELEQVELPLIPMSRTLDTVLLARQKFPGQPASLDALCKRFGIDLSARTKHGALLDSELLAEVYLELMGGRQASLGLKAASAAKDLAFASQADIPARRFSPSAEELASHKALLARMKDPLWRSVMEEA